MMQLHILFVLNTLIRAHFNRINGLIYLAYQLALLTSEFVREAIITYIVMSRHQNEKITFDSLIFSPLYVSGCISSFLGMYTWCFLFISTICGCDVRVHASYVLLLVLGEFLYLP